MDGMTRVLTLLPLVDWLAVMAFFAAWIGYAMFAKRRAAVQPSVLGSTNRWRNQWMLQSTQRENRIVDAAVIQTLSVSPSFFASTTILIIGGLLAILGTTDKASEFVKEIPFAARTTTLIFDLKLALLTGVFVFAFFRFTWSLRQYTFGAILVGATPEHKVLCDDDKRRTEFADRAGRVLGLAAETFNDGLRAYYFAFALVAWFVSPFAFMAATALVVFVLYRREFHSEVLRMLRQGQ
ncbi:MAG TPA: DUF599 domain-containing protein [Burkholderiaceae bacterium]|nr:DUF599 domain-containing protein [Burkholderiaceae bacterium]